MTTNHQNNQRTLARPVQCTGIGIHSGKEVHLAVKPAPMNHGIRFKRTDLLNSPSIPATFNLVVDTSLATVIGHDGFIVSTIEHLMASFSGLGIDNALVEVDSYELPIMDGSAHPFTRMLKAGGGVEVEAPRCFFTVTAPIEIQEDGRFVGVYPWPSCRITCSIEYEHPLIGAQQVSMEISAQNFQRHIAKARTFGFLRDYEHLKRYGLSQGCSLDNVVVVDDKDVLNPGGLRFADEFVRHKLLDCMGDFALLGMPVRGHIVARRTGHAFNHIFLEKFLAHKDAWETCSGFDGNLEPSRTPNSLAIS